MKFVYLSENELCLFKQGKAQSVRSLFLNKYRQNVIEIEKRKEWKKATDLKMSGGLAAFAQGNGELPKTFFEFKGACFCRDEILYALQVENVGGLFRADPESKSKFEGHLAHYPDVSFGSIQFHPQKNEILYSQSNGSIEEHLYQQNINEFETTQLTEGDCIDRNPSWDQTNHNQIVYQTAGIARNENGQFRGQSPWMINSLNLDTSENQEILAHPDFDYLLPKSLNNDLYYLEKPHFIPKPKGPGFFELLSVPFKLIHLAYQMLNFKNMQYTGKPLTGGSAMSRNDLDLNKLTIHGNLINAQDQLKIATKKGIDSPAIVPKSWQLKVLRANGETETLAQGVIAFDLDEHGNIIYSNGTSIKHLDPQQNETILLKNTFAKFLNF